jgi:hypothetical protein
VQIEEVLARDEVKTLITTAIMHGIFQQLFEEKAK